MLPEKQGEDWKDGFPARPGYVQTWHGPGQRGTGTAGPALLPQPWAATGSVSMKPLGNGTAELQ